MAEAPSNTAYLGQGRPLVDRAQLESEGVQPSVIEAIMGLQGMSAAMGYAGAAESGGTEYQNAMLFWTGSAWELYAARPDTPLTPDLVSGVSGGGEISVELDNVVVNAATTIVNFSTDFSVVDAGGGQVDVGLAGGGGTVYTAGFALSLTGDEFALDVTQIDGYNPLAEQYLKNNLGTLQWVDKASC